MEIHQLKIPIYLTEIL
jgi:hypothetical protein